MKTIGVYAGTFSPFHVGHGDILHQSQKLFDKVIIAIGINSEKEQIEKEKFPHGHKVLQGSEVVYYKGLLSDYLNELDFKHDDSRIFLIRGLRNGQDLQYEQNQLQYIKEMYPSLMTTFFICNKQFEHISSSSLRALKKFSEKDYQRYVYV